MGIVLGTLLSGLLSSTAAVAPQASGSVVINGKSVALTQGRAWKNGEFMGMPIVDIMLAQKPLSGLNWWKASDGLAQGQRGVVLRFKPTNAPADKAGQSTYHYVFDEDYQISLYAGDFRGWNEAVLVKDAVSVTDLSVSKGVVTGKLEWKGKFDNPFDDTQNVTAWSASFSLPIEDVGPMPTE